MLELIKGAKLILETCARVKPGEKVLVASDDEAFPMRMGKVLFDVATSLGADASMMVMKPREIPGQEPPEAIAVAMRSVNVVIFITNHYGIGHTNARKEATAVGVRHYFMTQVPEDYFKREITPTDIGQLRKRTDKLAQKLTKANRARVTTPVGTDITMNLEGRQGLGLHPQWGGLGMLPDYAEAAIAPVEGTTEGTIVIDVSILGWNYLLREPIKCVVKSGKVVEVIGGEDANRLRNVLTTDENASNIAELGLGTSHTIPPIFKGTRRDGGIIGTAHIGFGRSNDIGGQIWSRIHQDVLLDHPTVELDGKTVIQAGIIMKSNE